MPKVTVVTRPKEADGVLVVDASNLAHRAAYAYQDLKTREGQRSGHIFGTVRLLLSTLANGLDPGRWCIALAYDGHGAKAARQAVLPTYKAHRDPTKFDPMPTAEPVLRGVPGIHLGRPGLEGDDAVAWLAERSGPRKVVVLSGDKDLWQLLRFPHVSVLSPNLKRYVIGADIEKNYHVTRPDRIPLAKALFGDPSDGIKGPPRLFKKHIVGLLDSVNTLEDFFDSASNDATIPAKTRLLLSDHKEACFVNYEVIRPRIAEFSDKDIAVVSHGAAQRTAFVEQLRSYECSALIDMIGPLFGESP